MKKLTLMAAMLAMLLAVTAPALAQAVDESGEVPVGGITEDGFVRTSNDTSVDCDYYLAEGGQYEQACREAGFLPEEDGTGSTTDVAAPAPGGEDLNCEDFGSPEEAQAVLDADASDPNGLDADGDGLACNESISAPPTQAEEGQDLDCVGLLEAESTPEQAASPEAAQEQAQAVLAGDPTDPNGLDADGDGLACEFEESPTGQVAFEDGTGFVRTVTSAEAPQQYATPAPVETAAPIAPSEEPSLATQPAQSKAVTTVAADAAPEAKQPSSAGRSSSLSELPATGGYALSSEALVPLVGGVALVGSGALVLVFSRRRRAA